MLVKEVTILCVISTSTVLVIKEMVLNIAVCYYLLTSQILYNHTAVILVTMSEWFPKAGSSRNECKEFIRLVRVLLCSLGS
jgi:hypothetical protein